MLAKFLAGMQVNMLDAKTHSVSSSSPPSAAGTS